VNDDDNDTWPPTSTSNSTFAKVMNVMVCFCVYSDYKICEGASEVAFSSREDDECWLLFHPTQVMRAQQTGLRVSPSESAFARIDPITIPYIVTACTALSSLLLCASSAVIITLVDISNLLLSGVAVFVKDQSTGALHSLLCSRCCVAVRISTNLMKQTQATDQRQ